MGVKMRRSEARTSCCSCVQLKCLINVPCIAGSPDYFFDYGGARFLLCVNPNSGGKRGNEVANWFTTRYAEDIVVVRLGEPIGPQAVALTTKLEQWESDPSVSTVRLVVAGGDGTVSWALSTLETLFLPSEEDKRPIRLPPMVFFPLGTGNELSRCVGWGDGSTSTNEMVSHKAPSSYVEHMMQTAVQGQVEGLDRWVIEGRRTGESHSASSNPDFVRPMLCFFSVGFDAEISHKFSEWRDARPNLFRSMTINKAGYTCLGIQALLSPSPTVAGLLELMVDGKVVSLPSSLRTIQVFNIHASSDGVDFFGCSEPSVAGELQSYSPPSSDDGLLEVVGTEGVAHLMSTKLGFRHSHRLAQGREVVLTVLSPTSQLIAQVDGESWIPSGSMRVRNSGKVDIVIGPHGRYPGLSRARSSMNM